MTVQFYAEINRQVGFRDDNHKPLASNDPSTSTINWTIFGGAGPVATSDGDILSLSGTDGSHGITRSLSISSTIYPKFVVKAKGSGTITIRVQISGTPYDFTLNLTPDYSTSVFSLATGTVQALTISGQTVPGTNSFDYFAFCGLEPIQLSQKDLVYGDETRATVSIDMVTMRLNNLAGKFVTGSSSIGFADHLRVWMGEGTAYRVFGGYVEWRQTEDSQGGEVVDLIGKGWGSALQQTIVLKEYLASTPRTIINDIIDTFVNTTGTNYQITRSFVQDRGTSIGYQSYMLKPAWDCLKELGDLLTAQGNQSDFFVDPSENLHLVPLGPSGSPSWGTDPFSASYPTVLAIGTNQIINSFRKDVFNLKNRIHYFAIAQSPPDGDDWTENGTFSSTWATERIGPDTTATISSESTLVKIGSKSVKCKLDGSIAFNRGYEGAFYYPAAKNLALDISKLGSKKAPPVFDFYMRYTGVSSGPKGASGFHENTLFFATSTGNRFEYALVNDGVNFGGLGAILNDATSNTLTGGGTKAPNANTFYHVVLPIGPFGSDQYLVRTVGSPNWNNINYIGFFWTAADQAGGTTDTWYLDGWRILGGRYRIAFDGRASPPLKERREYSIFDPISKDEASIQNNAKAELLRLRDPILRGTFTCPLLGDLIPGQRVQVTAATAGLSTANLRAVKTIHRFSPRGFLTEIEVVDDFTNNQPLERFKLANMLLQSGHPGVKDREVYDLKTAIMDPSFPVTPTGGDSIP